MDGLEHKRTRVRRPSESESKDEGVGTTRCGALMNILLLKIYLIILGKNKPIAQISLFPCRNIFCHYSFILAFCFANL